MSLLYDDVITTHNLPARFQNTIFFEKILEENNNNKHLLKLFCVFDISQHKLDSTLIHRSINQFIKLTIIRSVEFSKRTIFNQTFFKCT